MTAYEMRISDWGSDVCSSDLGLLADAGVVGAAVADRLVEDRRVGGQPGDAVLVDVALQRAIVEDLAGDVVQPEALADVAQGLQVGHVDSCRCVVDSVEPSDSSEESRLGKGCVCRCRTR